MIIYGKKINLTVYARIYNYVNTHNIMYNSDTLYSQVGCQHCVRTRVRVATAICTLHYPDTHSPRFCVFMAQGEKVDMAEVDERQHKTKFL